MESEFQYSETDDLRPEYRWKGLGKGVLGKDVAACRKGTNWVLVGMPLE